MIHRKKRKILLVIWIMMMLFMSSRPATLSAQDSKTFEESFTAFRNELRSTESWVSHVKLINMSPKFVVRKAAHIFMYMILTTLAILVWINPHKRYRTYLWVILCCILYACLDEFHQTFVPGRTGLISDVFIDSIGIGLSGVFLMLSVELGYRKKWKSILRWVED